MSLAKKATLAERYGFEISVKDSIIAAKDRRILSYRTSTAEYQKAITDQQTVIDLQAQQLETYEIDMDLMKQKAKRRNRNKWLCGLGGFTGGALVGLIFGLTIN